MRKYIIIAAVLIVLFVYLTYSKAPVIDPEVNGGETSYEFTSPASGAEWIAEEESTVSWTPSGSGTVSLSIVNSTISEGYRYHLCAPEPPYPCELPNTGSFKFRVPADDGHYEWPESSDYQIAISQSLGSEILGISDKFSIVYGADVVSPPAPGPFTEDAVRNLMPKSLKVGANTINAEVRGYMFFEGETGLKLYDQGREVNIGTRPDGLPNTVVTAQGEWMTTNYVPVSQNITIPADLKGKTLVIRFVANDPSGIPGKTRYWGTWIKVE
jgi:hypothetical protein